MEKNTKDRVLEAACRLFSRDGYHDTTIALICREAQANVAAVNYYFGSKENLYLSAWKYADEKAREAYGSFLIKDPPQDSLLKIIERIIRMIFDPGPGGWFPRLIRKALEQRGESLEQILREFLAPRYQQIREVIASLLDCSVEEREVNLITGYVHSLCVHFNFHPQHRQQISGVEPLSRAEVDEIITSVQEFVLGGIERSRQHIHQAGLGCEGGGRDVS